jgi:hypothetical protein
MKAKQTLIFCGSIAVGLAACVLADDKLNGRNPTAPAAPKQERPASTITNAAAASDLAVIVYIERRGQTITVKAGPNGPVYSVKTVGGSTLFENLSAEQLHAQAPEVAQFIKTAVASGSGKSGVVIDARLDARIR